jgi:hypothetical protein
VEDAMKILKVFGVPLGVLLLLGAVLLVRPKHEDELPTARGTKTGSEAKEKTPAVLLHGYVPSERSANVAPAPVNEVGLAMTLTEARGSLLQLKLAYSSGDPDAWQSAREGLGIYPKTTIDLLEGELDPEEDPELRTALEEARKNAK